MVKWDTYLVFFAVAAYLGLCETTNSICEDDKSRAKYCHSADPDDIELCLSCYVGPRCPVSGSRSQVGDEGLLLLRGITNQKIQRLIVGMLNKKRLAEDWSKCVPLFTWDPDLASAAQAWADQCALVEYTGQNVTKLPHRLYHDSWKQRASVVTGRRFADEPGVGQTVHWARTDSLDLDGQTLEALIESDLQIEEGLIDGLLAKLPEANGHPESADEEEWGNSVMAWGHATHVGCGWIQFPTSHHEDGQPREYENFMVCNYGIGVASKTSCDNITDVVGDDGTFIKYYTVTSEVIRDVKACLAAVRCRRRRRRLFKTFDVATKTMDEEDDPCKQDVQICLNGKSGLKFIDASKLRSVARSNDISPIDVEAAKCKLDTILCGLNSTQTCFDRLRKCLPLLEIETSEESDVVQCECGNLVLADGTHGDCTEEVDYDDLNGPFCFVKHSPCVHIDPSSGYIETSKPYERANGLLHYTHGLC